MVDDLQPEPDALTQIRVIAGLQCVEATQKLGRLVALDLVASHGDPFRQLLRHGLSDRRPLLLCLRELETKAR